MPKPCSFRTGDLVVLDGAGYYSWPASIQMWGHVSFCEGGGTLQTDGFRSDQQLWVVLGTQASHEGKEFVYLRSPQGHQGWTAQLEKLKAA